MLFLQSLCIELYNASSTDIIQLWKIKGKIKKEFEPYSKSYYQILLNFYNLCLSKFEIKIY